VQMNGPCKKVLCQISMRTNELKFSTMYCPAHRQFAPICKRRPRSQIWILCPEVRGSRFAVPLDIMFWMMPLFKICDPYAEYDIYGDGGSVNHKPPGIVAGIGTAVTLLGCTRDSARPCSANFCLFYGGVIVWALGVAISPSLIVSFHCSHSIVFSLSIKLLYCTGDGPTTR